LLQNGMLQFVFWIAQSSEIELQC